MAQGIQDGRTVCLNYTLSLADGTVIDSAEQSGTWTDVHGHTKMPPGLAEGVEGLKIGSLGFPVASKLLKKGKKFVFPSCQSSRAWSVNPTASKS